ncbi:hypothetical protein HOY82DRAFT_552479, partial [Tuber indicum]
KLLYHSVWNFIYLFIHSCFAHFVHFRALFCIPLFREYLLKPAVFVPLWVLLKVVSYLSYIYVVLYR